MKRWVPTPECDSQSVNGDVLGVWLDDNERVKWVYTILSDGKRVVTGYDILPVLTLEIESLPQQPA